VPLRYSKLQLASSPLLTLRKQVTGELFGNSVEGLLKGTLDMCANSKDLSAQFL
jgi:hypothetical protein